MDLHCDPGLQFDAPIDGISRSAIAIFPPDGCAAGNPLHVCYFNDCASAPWSNDWWNACLDTGDDWLFDGETYFHVNAGPCFNECSDGWTIVVADQEHFGVLENVPVRSFDLIAFDSGGIVNLNDFSRFSALFASSSPCADWDDSGVVDLEDFGNFSARFLQSCNE